MARKTTGCCSGGLSNKRDGKFLSFGEKSLYLQKQTPKRMKKLFFLLTTFVTAMLSHAQNVDHFKNPPVETSNHVILGWDGEINQQVINADLDAIQQKGFRNVIIEPGYDMGTEYLSEQWFKNVKLMAEAVQRRGMRMWIIDEGKYPSGMAGGKFSKERPDLCMQALVPDGDGVKAVRRSSQTRCVNNPTRGKDESNSLCDYLDPEAVKQYINWTHDQYQKHLGILMETAVLGFRGDEPAFQRVPWTTNMKEIFEKQKGYDLTPYLNSFVRNERTSLYDPTATEQERRAKADYWDVWSRLFADNYFKKQAEWCQIFGVEHITHMDKDDMLPWCVKMEGDPFRCLSRVQVPGIDVIWSQIWMGAQTEFPRLASSVAHVYGKPRAFSESFAAFSHQLDAAKAKFVVDYQIARGINFFEFMFWMSKRGATGYMADPDMKQLNDYVNRTTWLMQQGKPTARIAIYAPIPTLWLGNNRADDFMKAAAHQLTRHQYDYDFITDDGIVEACTVGNGSLKNRSGQRYETLIVPSAEVITEAAWEKMSEFANRGGRIILYGDAPKATAGRSFMDQKPIVLPRNVLHVQDSVWTEQMVQALPEPEFRLVGNPNDSITCTVRRMDDGTKIFFVFNQKKRSEYMLAEFNKVGNIEVWNAKTGEIGHLQASAKEGKMQARLTFSPWEAKIFVVKKRKAVYDASRFRTIQQAIDRAHQDGGGTVVLTKKRYESGALFFPRGVDLRFEKGAELVSKVNPALYPIINTRWEGNMKPARAALLNFDHAEDCIVSGEGLIDAKGLEWAKLPRDQYGRPKTFCFDHCDGGRIEDVSVKNQAFWCLHVLFTDGFTIDGVNINAESYIPSSDGIDIDSSTDVDIRNVHIKAHDDCISIKSGKDTNGREVNQVSQDILIEDCHFDYGHGGVAMGSEVSGGIRNVTVRRCDFAGENWNPIRFKSQPSRGGIVENILFEDIDIAKARNIFEINMTWRMKGMEEPPYQPLTRLRNIRFRNIRGVAENAGIIHGFDEQPFTRDVFRFENCEIKVKTQLDIKNADVNLDGLNIIATR